MSEPFLEKTSGQMTGTLTDETGAVVPAASLTTLTLTLFDLASGTILNSRDAQNVLNTNNVTVSALGVLVWTIQPADNAIVNDNLARETHRALFQWTWSAGAKSGKGYQDLVVENLAKVT